MKTFIASVMAGSFLLIAALPAAGQSARSVNSNALALNSASDRDTYIQMARGEVREWQQKMRDFSDVRANQGDRGEQSGRG